MCPIRASVGLYAKVANQIQGLNPLSIKLPEVLGKGT